MEFFILCKYFSAINLAILVFDQPSSIIGTNKGQEISIIEQFLFNGQKILSIGGGIGGIELLILKKFPNTKIDLIEKNYMRQVKGDLMRCSLKERSKKFEIC